MRINQKNVGESKENSKESPNSDKNLKWSQWSAASAEHPLRIRRETVGQVPHRKASGMREKKLTWRGWEGSATASPPLDCVTPFTSNSKSLGSGSVGASGTRLRRPFLPESPRRIQRFPQPFPSSCRTRVDSQPSVDGFFFHWNRSFQNN